MFRSRWRRIDSTINRTLFRFASLWLRYERKDTLWDSYQCAGSRSIPQKFLASIVGCIAPNYHIFDIFSSRFYQLSMLVFVSCCRLSSLLASAPSMVGYFLVHHPMHSHRSNRLNPIKCVNQNYSIQLPWLFYPVCFFEIRIHTSELSLELLFVEQSEQSLSQSLSLLHSPLM